MQELKAAVAGAFDKAASDGLIQQAIEKHVSETVIAAIRDCLREYSDFGNQVKDAVKNAMKVDFDRLGLPGYNDLVLKLIRQTVEKHTDDQLKEQVEKQMTDLLAPAPATITLSQLVADFIKRNTNYYSCHCDGPTEITLIVEDIQHGMRWISMDKADGKDKYECDVRFLWSESDGHISALRFDRNEVSKTLFVGLYGFERDLFQMHVSGTKLIIDCDPDDINTSYPGGSD